MKAITNYLAILAVLTFSAACNHNQKNPENGNVFAPHPQEMQHQDLKTLGPGDLAPSFTLPNINGKMVSMDDFSKAAVLVIVFTCNHCPTAQAYEDRLINFTSDYRNKNVQVVAIMPNSGLGLLLEECGYSDLNDSYEEMKIRARQKHFNFPYLYDGDNHAVALKYGPVATPHVFVFDKERKLRYTGNLDQNEKPGTGNAENLRAAVDAVLAGKPVKNPETKSFGCSVKWAWKLDWVNKVNKDWNEKPVVLTEIDVQGTKDLMKNNTKKLRLVNVWATWCAPCVAEYPDLVKLQRMYGARDFEFVSVSADKISNKEKVHDFLKKSHSAIQNFIFSGGDNYKLIEAIDTSWNGALPYSVLVDPQGKIIWRSQGPADMLELKKTIVEHPLIGRYY